MFIRPLRRSPLINFKNPLKRALSALVLCAALWSGHSVAQGLSDNDIALIKVSGSGMYRITREELASNGIDLTGLTHRRLVLSLNGEQLSMDSEGRLLNDKRTNKFGAGASLTFYVPPVESLYSAQTALVLSFDRRTNQMRDQNLRVRDNDTLNSDYRQTLEFEGTAWYEILSPSDPWIYFPSYAGAQPSGSEAFVDTAGTSVDFVLDSLVGSTADLTAEMVGMSQFDVEGNDHHVVGLVNDTIVSDIQFDGFTTQELELNDASVVEGSNTFRFDIRSITTTPFDIMALNTLKVEYQRGTLAQNDYLDGEFAANSAFQASGFSDAQINVFRVEDSGEAFELRRADFDGAGSVQFKTHSQAGRYIAVSDSGFKAASVIEVAPALDDISSGGAEYLIISHSDFIGTSALDSLVSLRSASYSVKVVDVEQLYHQFSDLHVPSSEAITNYIRFAQENLGTRFVLFVGSDTYDYKGYLPSGSVSFVPTQYVQTRGDGLTVFHAPSDAKYGDLDDDNVPDLPVGRFPVRTEAELANIVEKINDYEARVGYPGRILMVPDKADSGNSYNFTQDALSLIDTIPRNYSNFLRSEYRALPDIDGVETARDKLFAAINAGVSVTAYIGHSNPVFWANTTPAMLNRSEIAGLTNHDKPTLVTQWGCYNTYFVNPAGNSIAELFLNSGLNGAATVLGASTLTKAATEYLMATELNQVMYNRKEMSRLVRR